MHTTISQRCSLNLGSKFVYRMLKSHFYYHLFLSPSNLPDGGAAIAGGLLGGAIGGSIAAAASAKRTVYRIDLTNGSLIDVGFKK